MPAIAIALAIALAAEEPAAVQAETAKPETAGPEAATPEPVQPQAIEPEAVEQVQKRPASRWAAFSVIVAGAAIAGVGVGFRYSAGENYDHIDRNYPPLTSYSELQQLVSTGQLHQQLGAGFLIAGAAIMVLGAILSMVLP